MAAIGLAILGDSEPLYVREFADDHLQQGGSSSSRRRRASDDDLFGLSSRGDSAGEQPRRRAARCSLELVLHSAADRFEELVSGSWRPPGATGSDAMFVGFLESVDSTRLYGYMTTTRVRFLLAVEDRWPAPSGGGGGDVPPDGDGAEEDDDEVAVRRLFAKLHRIYVEHTLNPFSAAAGPIRSPRFDCKVSETVAAFNRSVVG